MTKPTLIQTLFNRPSQSYAFPRDKSSPPHPRQTTTTRVTSNLGRLASPFKPISISGGHFSTIQGSGAGVGDNLSSIEAQDSSTHVSSSSRASHSDPSTLSAATSIVPSHSSPPPSPPPKDTLVSDSTPRPSPLRNTAPDPDNVSQPLTGHVHLGALPPNHSRTEDNDEEDEEDEDEEEDSTQDVFYTPDSSPRASFTTPASVPMSYASTMTPPQPPRKTSRPSLLEKTGIPERSHSHRSVNRNAETTSKESTPYSWKTKTNSDSTAGKTHPGGAISKELPPPASVLPPPPPSSTRIAVPSTRTPSRSNSLNRGRQNLGSRAAATIFSGQGQRQASATVHDRTMATVSIASATSSMSSNTLNGHSVVFSDLTTAATSDTTPLAGVSSTSRNSKGQYESTKSGASGKATLDQSRTATRTHKDPSPSIPPSSKRKASKSHTYNGLSVNGTASPSGPRSNAPVSGSTTTYYQYQRGRDMKHSGPMLSMTAVLEAAEEEELLRNGMRRATGGPSTSKARQVLKEHSTKKSSILASGSGTAAGGTTTSLTSGINSDSKGKGKERARHDLPGLERDMNGKDRERRRDYATHHKHLPHTPSPLAMSTSPKPLPTPGSASSLPRNNSLLEVPMFHHPRLGRQRSRSLGAESKPRINQHSESPASSSHSHIQMDLMRSHSRSPGLDSYASSSGANANNGIVDLTALPQSSGELPSNGVAGHSALVLPRAPPPLNLVPNGHNRNGPVNGGGDGKVDLTRDGLAQTTMASVEVVRGLGSATGKKGLMALLQSRGKSVRSSTGTVGGGGRREEGGYSGGKGNVLGFTNYRRPPDYVPSGSVLVQVWAVGVDGIDGRLVGVKMVNGEGAGVPPEGEAAGRSEESLDESRGKREDTAEETEEKTKQAKKGGLGRSLSLRERFQRSVSLGRATAKEFLKQQRQERLFQKQQQQQQQATPDPPSQSPSEKHGPAGSGSGTVLPGIGLIPGRSFVGRVVECGWEVREDVLRKGDWVAGLLNIKKCGGLTEFVVVDRHRVHRVAHPKLSNRDTYADAPSSLVFSSPPASPTTAAPMIPHHSLTLEELALLPLCGVPAYRAVRTFTYAFSSMRENLSSGSIKRTPSERTAHGLIRTDSHGRYNSAAHGGGKIPHLNLNDHENGRRRRALVLRGHDGIGSMAVQMLVHRGWRVCVHVPFIASPPSVPTTSAAADRFMEEVEERIRSWGAEEVIFDDGEVVGTDEGRGAIVRVIDGLTEDGDTFDVVLDTVGGKEVREAAERLLRSPGRKTDVDENDVGRGRNGKSGARGMSQFTTVIGDNPERVIPSAGDMFRAGLRSLKFGTGTGGTTTNASTDKGSSENVHLRNTDSKGSKVGYAWINISQDLDYEGKDVGDTIGTLVELALEYGIKPWVGAEHASKSEDREEMRSGVGDITKKSGFGHWEGRRIVSFEKAPDIFVDSGPLSSGGTVVVKIAA